MFSRALIRTASALLAPLLASCASNSAVEPFPSVSGPPPMDQKPEVLPLSLVDAAVPPSSTDAGVPSAGPIIYKPVLSPTLQWVAPSVALPPQVSTMPSNNNCDIVMHKGRLYMTWRTAPTHFASSLTKLYVISSADMGVSWDFETVVDLKTDAREPLLLSYKGELYFQFFEAGTNPAAFQPKAQWRTRKLASGGWSPLEQWGTPGEITWSLKEHNGVVYRSSYEGNHYQLGASDVSVLFTQSTDARTWAPLRGDGVVYKGGVSEVAFEFATDGGLWAITRNEDGDASGFGSHVCTAPAGALGTWTCSSPAMPERYDSPKMFAHGEDIYILARRDPVKAYDEGMNWLPFAQRKQLYLLNYSRRPKRTALYRVDKSARKPVWMFDFPSGGDTAFPSWVRLSEHKFLIANYTSPLDKPDISWLEGQTNPRGTQIYFATVEFVPDSPATP